MTKPITELLNDDDREKIKTAKKDLDNGIIKKSEFNAKRDKIIRDAKQRSKSTTRRVIEMFLFIVVSAVIAVAFFNSAREKGDIIGGISEYAVEEYCQDAALLKKYINMNQTSIISTTDYNSLYSDTGYFDNNGDKVVSFSWNGKDKNSGNLIRFSCFVSGSGDGNISLKKLNINATSVYGSGFKAYDVDGQEL